MSAPPTPIINLDSPKEVYEVDDCAEQWTQDSTESAKNGTLQEWITEPLQMLTSASPPSSQSPNNEYNAPSSTTEDVEVKNEFAELPALTTGTSQLVSLTTNGQNRLAVSTTNGPSTMPATSNRYHQVYSAPTTSSEFQITTSRPNNGYHQQIPIPANSNGTNYGVYNYGVHYTGSNGVPGYAPNGVHIMNVRPPTQVVHPMRANGGYNFNMPNGPNGYVHGMVNGRLIRPGWVSTNKVVNGVKKQKRNRTAFTSHQMMELEQEYAKARYLDRTRRIELSETLNLNQRTIKIWFQNRRMKEKKDRLDEVTTSDSPPENMADLPIFLQDASFVPLGVENMQYNPAMYAESMPMSSMAPMLPSGLPQPRQIPQPYLVENSIPVYNPVHANGVQAPQPSMIPMNGNMNNTSGNAEENWDLSWIRSINITEEELA